MMKKPLNLFFSKSLNFIYIFKICTKLFLLPIKFFICFISIASMITINLTILRNLNIQLSDTDTLIFYITLISVLLTLIIFIFLTVRKINFSSFVKIFTSINAFFVLYTSILIMTYGCLFHFRVLFAVFFISCILLNINKKSIVKSVLLLSLISCIIISFIILYTWDCTIPLRIGFGISSFISICSSIYLSFKR